MLLWTFLFLIFQTFQRMVNPPAQPAGQVAANVDGDNGNTDLEADDDAENLDPDGKTSQDNSNAEIGENSAGQDAAGAVPATLRPKSAQWTTLGSMAPGNPYWLLVTLNSRGAGIERIEVTQRDDAGKLMFRRVDTRSGYLGYLALGSPLAREATDDDQAPEFSGDPIVNVVGPGTPADVAGIKVGDEILRVHGSVITDNRALEVALAETRPKDVVEVELRRGGQVQTLSVKLTEHPLDLVRLASTGGVDQVPGNLDRLSCLLTLAEVNGRGINPSSDRIRGVTDPVNLIWKPTDVVQPESTGAVRDSAAYECPLSSPEVGRAGGALTLHRSYRLQPDSFVLDLEVGIENQSQETQDLAYRLEGPNGLTLEGWWYSTKISPNFFGGAAARDLIYRPTGDDRLLYSGFDLLKRAKKTPEDPRETMFATGNAAAPPNFDFVGIDTQYFLVSYIPPEDQAGLNGYQRLASSLVTNPGQLPQYKERAVNTSFVMDSETFSLAAGERVDRSIRMFAGPKKPEILQAYGLGDAIYYGWFSGFSRLLAWVLHGMSFLGYSLAIILLTLLVRAMMFPFSRKAAINAQKMQELAPEMKKIAEQYKDDMEGRLKAQQALQKRVGFNPLAGCLPMFFQFPIFIGLYRALSVDIELRQQPFMNGLDWASNLAAPDMFAYWGNWMPDYFAGRGSGWLGPYFNLLPILVVALFLTQQKLFMPPATDDQTRLTQKMMNIMTLMMGLFFFRVPAGLCIYFITSSLWGICERVLVKKTVPKTTHFDPAVVDGTATATKKKTITERVMEKVQEPEPKFERPNKRKRPKKR
ncbi:MAG: YidC/Oxa1 family insertase periplasmic-domain containing protein [Planctomycetota bacterium]